MESRMTSPEGATDRCNSLLSLLQGSNFLLIRILRVPLRSTWSYFLSPLRGLVLFEIKPHYFVPIPFLLFPFEADY
jgi:hypothetical protein